MNASASRLACDGGLLVCDGGLLVCDGGLLVCDGGLLASLEARRTLTMSSLHCRGISESISCIRLIYPAYVA